MGTSKAGWPGVEEDASKDNVSIQGQVSPISLKRQIISLGDALLLVVPVAADDEFRTSTLVMVLANAGSARRDARLLRDA